MARQIKPMLFVAVLVTVAGIALLFQSQSGVLAQQGCTWASLQGTYIWSNDGYFIDDDQQTPFAYAGREVYDGVGNLTGVYSGNDDGGPIRNQAYSGTYTVNADCTGTLVTTDEGSDEQTSFDIFIDASGGDFYFTNVDEGTVSQGFNKKQD